MSESTTSSAREFEAVVAILKKHDYHANKLIPILQEVQEIYRYLPSQVLNFVATSLQLSSSKVYGVATFYGHFSLSPKGKNIVKVCNGTACHVKGAGNIFTALAQELGLTDGKNTTPDMLFTVETVSCLGACGIAPVVLNNEQVYGQTDGKKMVSVIKEIKANS